MTAPVPATARHVDVAARHRVGDPNGGPQQRIINVDIRRLRRVLAAPPFRIDRSVGGATG